MSPYHSNKHVQNTCRSSISQKLSIATLLLVFASTLAAAQAQDILIGATYVCDGEHIYIEGCNVRDTSDTSTCMVAHPDHLTPTGLNTYTSMTRGALKSSFPPASNPPPSRPPPRRHSKSASRTSTTPT